MLRDLHQALNLHYNKLGYNEFAKWYCGLYDLKSEADEFELKIINGLKEKAILPDIVLKSADEARGRKFSWVMTDEIESDTPNPYLDGLALDIAWKENKHTIFEALASHKSYRIAGNYHTDLMRERKWH